MGKVCLQMPAWAVIHGRRKKRITPQILSMHRICRGKWQWHWWWGQVRVQKSIHLKLYDLEEGACWYVHNFFLSRSPEIQVIFRNCVQCVLPWHLWPSQNEQHCPLVLQSRFLASHFHLPLTHSNFLWPWHFHLPLTVGLALPGMRKDSDDYCPKRLKFTGIWFQHLLILFFLWYAWA